MNSFLQQTAKSILDHSGWEQLRQMTLVLPSRRAGLVLKDELLRLQKDAGEQAVAVCTERASGDGITVG